MSGGRSSWPGRAVVGLAAAALALGPLPGVRAEEFGVAARVNGVAITAERLERYFEEYMVEKGRSPTGIRSPSAFKRLKREALELLIEEELLWQEAQRKKVLASQAQVEAALRDMRAAFKTPEAFARKVERGGFTLETYPAHVRRVLSIELLVRNEVFRRLSASGKEVREYYREHPEQFVTPEGVQLRHVLIRVPPPGGEAERAAARARAEQVLAEARAGADFAELARKHSEDSSAAQGGDLGLVSRGQMLRPFEEAAFALAPGEISGVVETVFGYHVIQAGARRPAGRVPLAQARERIRQRLLQDKARAAIRKKIDDLRAEASVDIVIPLQ